MVILISEKWQVTLDEFGNYIPYKWKESEGGVQVVNKPKGVLSKPFSGFVCEKKYFGSLGAALGWIVNEDMQEGEVYHLHDYYNERELRIKDLLAQFKRKNPYDLTA